MFIVLESKSVGQIDTASFLEHAVQCWSSERQKDFPMLIVLKDNNTIIGSSGYNEGSNPEVPRYEIGYWLDTRYTGQELIPFLVETA